MGHVGTSGSEGSCWRSTEAGETVLLSPQHTSHTSTSHKSPLCPAPKAKDHHCSCQSPFALLLQAISAAQSLKGSLKSKLSLNLGTNDIRCWVILCVGRVGPVHRKMLGSIPGLYPLGTRSIHLLVMIIKTVFRHCPVSLPLLAEMVKQTNRIL